MSEIREMIAIHGTAQNHLSKKVAMMDDRMWVISQMVSALMREQAEVA